MRAVIDTSFGALFEGENIGCAQGGADPLYTNFPFTISLWVNIFNPFLEDQYLYCDNMV